MGPIPNVSYRIQSVDFNTNLELYDATSGLVILRPKSDSPFQRWIFTGSGSSFGVLNNATKAHKNPQYLDAPKLKGEADDQHLDFEIKEVKGGSYVIYHPSHERKWNTYLQTSDDGKPAFDKIRPIDAGATPRNLKWRLVEVRPASVQQGVYRIRAFPTDLCLEIPSGGVNISLSTLKPGAKHQEWEVIPIANGRVQIEHVAEQTFLGWKQDSSGEMELAKVKKPFGWKIKEVGKATYSVSFRLKEDKFVVTRGTQNELVLKPKEEAKNRYWIFDSSEPTVDESDTDTDSEGVTDPEGTNQETIVLPTTRYEPFIDRQLWYIKNVQTGNYIWGNNKVNGNTPLRMQRWEPRSEKDAMYGKLWLMYLDEGNRFTLAFAFANSPCASLEKASWSYVAAVNGAIDIDHPESTGDSTWVLAAEGDTGNYYVHLANGPGMVIEEDTKAGTYKVAQQRRGAAAQLWTFIKG